MIPLQTIKNMKGRAGYVLLPVFVYLKLKQLKVSQAYVSKIEQDDYELAEIVLKKSIRCY